MARFQRSIPVLAIVLIVLLGSTATFITEVRGIRAVMASAATDANLSPAESDNLAGTASMIDIPGQPY